jgi:site-specific recombinase XerD
MKTTQTFSILIWANKAKSTDKGIPINARVTIDGLRAEISLKKKVSPEKWDSKAGYVTGSNAEAKTINNYINQVKAEIFKLYTEMQMLDEFITAESLKLRFIGVKEIKKSILEIFDFHNTEMAKNVGVNIEQVTLNKYITVRKKVANFILHQYKKNDFFLQELNHQFVTNFEFYLKSVEHIDHNSTMRYIRNLKKIINDAVRNEWMIRNPFDNFKCSLKKVEREILTLDEVTLIQEKQFHIPRLNQVRDLFVFSCYTGLAYVDVMRLTPQNIALGIDGESWIITHRKKTDESVKIPLLPAAIEIIHRYENQPEVSIPGGILPRMSNQKLNSYLKEIADLCGIEKNLTFHLARHTFATTITLSNGVPIETVSKLLGHTSIKTTQIYAKVIESKVSEDMKNLKRNLSTFKKNSNATSTLPPNFGFTK